MRIGQLICLALVLSVAPVSAQEQVPCRVLCAPEFHVEPTITFANLFGSPRIAGGDGIVTREPRETEFEVILSLGLPTRLPWLEFTVEAIFLRCPASAREAGSAHTSTSSINSVLPSVRRIVAHTRTS